jgi:integrase
VDRLSAQDILTVLHALKERGLGNTTIRACYTLLRAALNQAVEQRLIAVNPMNGLDGPPPREQKEAGFLTPDQARRFLDEAALDPFGLVFALCLYTGMRPGEARGLQWKDIDFTGNRIHVRHAVSYGKAGWYIKKPKSGKPRTVVLGAALKEALLLHCRAQALEKARAGQAYENHDLVFANGLGAPLSESGLTKRHFKKILERAGLPLTLSMYSLRHTCATLALVAAPLKEVAEQLGHKDPALTARIYAHVLPDAAERISSALEADLAPGVKDEGEDAVRDV